MEKDLKAYFDIIANNDDDYCTTMYRGKRIAVVDWKWFKSVAPEFKERAASTGATTSKAEIALLNDARHCIVASAIRDSEYIDVIRRIDAAIAQLSAVLEEYGKEG